MRRAPARVSPLRSAAPVSVCWGASAPKLRSTASPRANDCTKASPGRFAAGEFSSAAGTTGSDMGRLSLAGRLHP